MYPFNARKTEDEQHTTVTCPLFNKTGGGKAILTLAENTKIKIFKDRYLLEIFNRKILECGHYPSSVNRYNSCSSYYIHPSARALSIQPE